ncbi:UBIQUITIN CARBOXYL-TERMINAL HYDROLASE [Salix viminalis]|uniref:ubiquitinyl hydrolase 1 n=1 Tax=Salix viminalis TaxID=40686 RepID=A0A9Q0NNZ2_SALVM|nr:UBIQUITIN CARBOXYL-TERMINAL HYDROLASE [Salix viminalis]
MTFTGSREIFKIIFFCLFLKKLYVYNWIHAMFFNVMHSILHHLSLEFCCIYLFYCFSLEFVLHLSFLLFLTGIHVASIFFIALIPPYVFGHAGHGDCCIAHRVFSGILRSDVMCTACGFTSTTYDPCVDISLDLEPYQGSSAKSVSLKTHSCNGEADCKNSSQNGGISTLIGCLDRFTRPERLGSDQKFFCQQCQVRQESLKQMSIRKLPLVSCFHIKRFEHSSIRKMSRKVDRYLQFPFSLDMAPYLSSSILRSRFGNRVFPFDGDETDASNEMSSEFELFAVVTHTGKLDAGHYVTYLRLSNQWYKCDDSWITRVNENIVRSAQGYMMFLCAEDALLQSW